MAETHNVHIISHTHWDREWYLPRERFRLMLVEMVDSLLNILEHQPDYKAFMLDGQAIILEDYLEMRPQNEETLREYIQEGRILIGPWYVLADELLISGEAHIRNYILGAQVCQRFGCKMNVGYLPDSFGHPAQMPQILSGLGLKEMVFWRGLGPEIKKTEFIWIAPDGSQILAINMPYGYSTAACMPREPEKFVKRLTNEINRLLPFTDSCVILLMNGSDHLAPQPFIPANIEYARRHMPNYNIIHSTLPDFVDDIKSAADGLTEVYRGELRSGYRAYLLGGTISTRMYLKQANHAAEQLLEKWLEPFSTMAWLLGLCDYPHDELRYVWKLALSNLPHDSICGCSVDEVHEEMMQRYAYIDQAGNAILDKQLHVIANNAVPDDGGGEYDGIIVVFNPLGHNRTDKVEVSIDKDTQLLRKVDYDRGELVEYEIVDPCCNPIGIEIYDAKGNRLPAVITGIECTDTMKLSLYTQPEMYKVQRCKVSFIADDVPSVGFASYRFKWVYGQRKGKEDLSRSPIIENEYFRVVPNIADGTIDVYDKSTGYTYKGLNAFADGADAGDEYTYSPPLNDRIIGLDASSIEIIIGECNEVKQSIFIKGIMNLPVSLSDDRINRVDSTVACPIETVISVYAGVKRIDITTTFDNLADDHRLRVVFPTGIHAEHAYAESQFFVERRKIVSPEEMTKYADWAELPSNVHPCKTFVDVSDGHRGLAIANKGLPEFEVYSDGQQNLIALTLLRCVGWLSRQDLLTRKGNGGWTLPTPGAQCRGKHVFEYSMIPHVGTWGEGNVAMAAHDFNTPLKAVVRQNNVEGKNLVLETFSIIKVDPAHIIVSAIKKAENGDGVIVRLYNLSDKPVNASLDFGLPIERAWLVTLDERYIQSVDVCGQSINLTFKPWEIKTLCISPR